MCLLFVGDRLGRPWKFLLLPDRGQCRRRLFFLRALLNHAFLHLLFSNSEIRHDAKYDEQRGEHPGRLLEHIRGLTRSQDLLRSAACGNTGKPPSLAALHKHYQRNQDRNHRD